MDSEQFVAQARVLVADNFERHSMDEEQTARSEALRKVYMETANAVLKLLDNGREKATALTNLEQSLMWATKSIALEKGDSDGRTGN